LAPWIGPRHHPLVAALKGSVLGQILLLLALAPLAMWLEATGGNTTAYSPIDFNNLRPEMVAMVMVAAPLVENLIMVGAILLLGIPPIPAFWRVVIVGLLAGAAHLDAGEALFAAAPGVLFAAMAWQFLTWRERKGPFAAYIATVIFHAVWNTLLMLWLGLIALAGG
jgi:hypothetical protein